MSTLIYPRHLTKHQASMLSSLEHRLEVAQANHNAQLITLLEQEKQAIVSDDAPQTDLFVWLQAFWQVVVTIFSPSQTLQVQRIADPDGNLWWYAYDPHSGRSVYAESETEMRLWIEERDI